MAKVGLPFNENRSRLLQLLITGKTHTTKELLEKTGLGWGCLHYHLHRLATSGLIGAALVQGRRIYYSPPNGNRLSVEFLELASSDAMRRLARLILANSGLSQKEIQAVTGISQRMCSYYLQRLEARGLIQRERRGNFALYSPATRLPAELSALTRPGPASPMTGSGPPVAELGPERHVR